MPAAGRTAPPQSSTIAARRSAAAASLACSTGTAATTYDQKAGSQSASVGGSSVTVAWTSRDTTVTGNIRGATITLALDGASLLDEPFTPPSPSNDAPPDPLFSDGWQVVAPVCLAAPPAGEPTVYVTGFAGGASCCVVERVYYPFGAGAYRSNDRDMGRSPVTVERAGTTVVVIAANRDFVGRFDCDACSGAPVQVLEFGVGQFRDVTSTFPAQVAADAQQWWATYQRNPTDPLGFLAAWAADECELGHEVQTFATLSTMASAGELTPPGSQVGSVFSPTGKDYVSALRTFLRQEGYCP